MNKLNLLIFIKADSYLDHVLVRIMYLYIHNYIYII